MVKKKFFTETSFGALIEEIKSYVESKVSGKANKAVVGTITYDTSLRKYVCDKTYEELYTAYSSGQTIELHSSSSDGSYIYNFMGQEPSVLIFSNFYNDICFVYRIYHDSETNTDQISELYFPFVNSEGATMTGALTLASNPTDNLHAATKQYVDSNVEGVQTTLDELTNVYSQNEEPIDAEDGSLWIDLDDSIGNVIDNAGLLPSVTTANNGQFLRVVNGVWTAVTIPNAEEATF